jgi:hypothetical protein
MSLTGMEAGAPEHGIASATQPEAPYRMIVLGYPRFARRQMAVFTRRGWRSTFIESRFILHGLFSVRFCSAVYQIGMPVVPAAIFDACGRYGRPIIKHWVGTDVLRSGEPESLRQNALGRIEHWADAPWLADELATVGIRAKFVGLSPVAEVPEMALPPAPLTVLTYLPEDKYEFYGAQIVYELARRMPEARFLVLASERRGRATPENIEFIGLHDDMEPVYAKCHALVRMPDHDGMSQMVLEALNHGRYVVWNYALEGVARAADSAEALVHLQGLAAHLRAGTLVPNDAGRAYVRRDFLGSTVADRLCEGIIASVRRSRNGAVHAS